MKSNSNVVPKRPPASAIGHGGYAYEIHFDDKDSRIITAVYRTKLTPPGNKEYIPPKPKPKWWQFWRWGEDNLYNHW